MTVIERVLVVEDIPEVCAWLAHSITSCFDPRHITTADSHARAATALATEAFDLALFDLGLPDGDGTTLIPLFKQHNPNRTCIITTIFDDDRHLFDALRAGADGYLLKGSPHGEFTDQLRSILEGRPPLSASIARRLLQQFQPRITALDELTPRETDLLKLIASGLSVRSAATKLGISAHTASGYLKVIYQKLQVHNRAEATLKAVNLGLVG
ncbi:response regulator transcription factor [Sinimarinibacterium sp. NLF-5-8]|uniref:response regulator transcription factor n=1 Tax=Sinimarinibacterium sp. NLF-5-8 TaxID=2698684 RepID=UPI00137BBB37|nr:response regulator transcription factor [Sinimarinibacterium sp. NLF-5-8]QHS09939.1 response regulator transcription factor [Sinimarinibacterium sp. NLF-5-8]